MAYMVQRAIESDSLLACSPDMSRPPKRNYSSGLIFWGWFLPGDLCGRTWNDFYRCNTFRLIWCSVLWKLPGARARDTQLIDPQCQNRSMVTMPQHCAVSHYWIGTVLYGLRRRSRCFREGTDKCTLCSTWMAGGKVGIFASEACNKEEDKRASKCRRRRHASALDHVVRSYS